jgi:hypothetical protein
MTSDILITRDVALFIYSQESFFTIKYERQYRNLNGG